MPKKSSAAQIHQSNVLQFKRAQKWLDDLPTVMGSDRNKIKLMLRLHVLQ
jgi:hypothetical protein